MGKLAEQAEAHAETQKQEQALVPTRMSRNETMDILLSPSKFEQLQRAAKLYAHSTLVPKHFQGKVENVFIALQLSLRMGIDPFMLMQGMYVVYGNPGLSAKLIVSLFNERDQIFDGWGIRYDIKRDRDEKIVSCTAWSIRRSDAQRVDGPAITPELVRAEGWDKPKKLKDGSGSMPSKWVTMPEMMYRYRAAAWFVAQHNPGVILGLRSSEELQDIKENLRVEFATESDEEPTGEVVEAEVVEEDVPDLKDLKPAPEPKPKKPPKKKKEEKEKKVVVRDNTAPAPAEQTPEPGKHSMGDIMKAVDMVGMPVKVFEAQCNFFDIDLQDRSTYTQERLARLDRAIHGYVDEKNSE